MACSADDRAFGVSRSVGTGKGSDTAGSAWRIRPAWSRQIKEPAGPGVAGQESLDPSLLRARTLGSILTSVEESWDGLRQKLPTDWPVARRIGLRAVAAMRAAFESGLRREEWLGEARSAADASTVAVALAGFGERGEDLIARAYVPVTTPEIAMPMRAASVPTARLEAECSSLISALPPQSWGVSLRLTGPALGSGAWREHQLVSGPFDYPLAAEPVARECARAVRLVWDGCQIEDLSGQLITAEFGFSPDAIVGGYLKTWVSRDVGAGASVGSALAESDAAWRARYIALARRWWNSGQDRKAAIFAKAAYDTLQPEKWSHSARDYTLRVPAPVTDDFMLPTADGTLRPRALLANEILDEFRGLSVHWPRLEAERTAHVSRLGSVADEGYAVWYEILSAWLTWKGFIYKLAKDQDLEQAQNPAEVVAQYVDESATSLYMSGFDLVTRAVERTSILLFAYPGLYASMLWQPLEWLEQRLTVLDLESMPLSHYGAPNERLQRLATCEAPTDSHDWVDGVFQLLDRHERPLVVEIEEALHRHEEESP